MYGYCNYGRLLFLTISWLNIVEAWLSILTEKQIRSCLLYRESQGLIHLLSSLEFVLESSEKGNTIFPLSLIHLVEMSSRLDKQERDRFYDFLFKVSKGYAIVPFVRIIDFEIMQAARKQAGLPTIDLKHIVVGKGLPYIIGAIYYPHYLL